MAVGLSTGRVDLLRLEATKHARRNNILSSGPIVSLPVRNTRSCNALAFCTADPNYLAVGLDKVRGDCSLVIWDISSSASVLSLSPSVPAAPPVLSPSSRPQPHIPRADVGPRADARVLQQHAFVEIVSSLSFLPQSTHLLLAGISSRWLRMFDLRSPVPSITDVPSKIQGITTDPFDPHRIGTFGDGIVTIWDTRKLPHPLLTFSERDASADGARISPGSGYSSIEFSSTRRGTLAALQRDATYVRFWDITEARAHNHSADRVSPDEERSRESLMNSRTTRKSWANLPWAAASVGSGVIPPSQPSALKEKEQKDSDAPRTSLILADTRRSAYNPPQARNSHR